MNICHYLFWKENEKITAVVQKETEWEVIRFGGYTAVPYAEDYWENWREYAGFLKEDLIDFCFVFDKDCPQITEELKQRVCSEAECIWDKYTIQKIVDRLEISLPTRIYNQEGYCIARTGCFRGIQESEIRPMMAVYRNAEERIVQQETKQVEMTPFIRDMLTKLKKYDKQ